MARIPMDAFEEGTEIVRVYLAASLREAQDVEAALDAGGFDFAVEVEAFPTRPGLGPARARTGAGFWVHAAQVSACAAALERGGHVAGLVSLDEG
jgi:hypothetical protein